MAQCSGGAAGSDRVGMEPQVEEKQSEHESKTEMSRMNENVEMVVEMEVTGETDDLGEMAKVTVVTGELMGKKGELGEKGVVTGELGEGGVEVSGWRPAPMKQRSRGKNMMKDVGGSKTGQLEKSCV